MIKNILIGGFGGQGVILVGQMLGYASIAAEKNATFFPSYGPEQRGGTANCSVVISDEEIGSPVVTAPDVLVCFNSTALEKFLPQLKPGGLLLVNSSQVSAEMITRTDIRTVQIPINQLADELGSPKVANIIMYAAIVSQTGVISIEQAEKTALEKLARKPQFLELNRAAFACGINYS